METKEMREIRKNLAELTVLEQRAKQLGEQLTGAEEYEARLRKKYEKESHDVEKLMKDSFTALLLQHIGQYEGRLSKENCEKLSAKLEYDKARDNLQKLRAEQDELNGRIKALKRDERDFDAELKKRKEQIQGYLTEEAYERYGEIDSQLKYAEKRLAKTREAIRAASRALSTAQSAAGCFESAQGWATFDAWTRGGILSHAAKYDRVDEAKSYINTLEAQLEDLKRELNGIDVSLNAGTVEINSFTRAVDFWFDNLFTDLNVRSIICDNKEQMVSLCEQLNKAVETLEGRVRKIEEAIAALEQKEEEIIVG